MRGNNDEEGIKDKGVVSSNELKLEETELTS